MLESAVASVGEPHVSVMSPDLDFAIGELWLQGAKQSGRCLREQRAIDGVSMCNQATSAGMNGPTASDNLDEVVGE